MIRFLQLGLCLAVFAFPAPAQEPTKTATEAKPAEATQDATRPPDLAAKRQHVAEAERALRDARRDMEQAARTQAQQAAKARDALSNLRLGQYYPSTRYYRPSARNSLVGSQAEQDEPYGLGLAEADPVLRSQLDLPADQGLVVTRVVEKRLADQAGLKLNDVVMKLDNKPVGKVSQVREVLSQAGKRSVEAELIREGKPWRISLVGPKHGIPDAPTTYWIGVPVAPVDATLRSHLAALPEQAGLIATDIVDASPAAKAGIKKNDILIKFNDKPISTQEALVDLVQKSEGKESKVELLRAGKVVVVGLTPEKRTANQVNPGSATIDLGDGPQVFTYDMPIFKPDPANPARMTNLIPWVKSGDLAGQINAEVANSLKGLEGRTLDVLKLDARSDAELQRQMKALTGQIEDLRKAIEELKKALPAGKDAKTGFNSPDWDTTSFVSFLGAFWWCPRSRAVEMRPPGDASSGVWAIG